MNHFILLVLVVFAVIWILNQFLRSAQEERTANRRRTPSGQSEGQGSRRQKTEIEQFLEEVNRRRREKTESQQPPQSEASVPMPTPLATRSTRPAGSARPDARRQRSQVKAARTTPEREARAVLTEAVLVAEPRARPSVGQATLGQLTSIQDRPAPPVLLTTMAPEIKAAPLAELTAVLQSTEGMRAAMILQEVLGPPRCQRPR